MPLLVNRAMKRVIKTGTLVDQPPALPQRKAAKYYDLLVDVVNALLEGRITNALQNVPYHSVEQAARYNPIIDTACEVLGLTEYNSLWRLLQQTFPKLRKSNIQMIGQRDTGQAIKAAQELLGRAPMDFSYVSKGEAGSRHLKHHPLLQRVAAGYLFFYKYAQLFCNVFLDAAKTEPARWAAELKGITHRGLQLHERIVHGLLKVGS